MTAAEKAAKSASSAAERTRKTAAIYNSMASVLARGSRRWMHEPVSMYLPMIMRLAMRELLSDLGMAAFQYQDVTPRVWAM
ncbi:hypothetical protein D3C75_964260 [compost metagenome]